MTGSLYVRVIWWRGGRGPRKCNIPNMAATNPPSPAFLRHNVAPRLLPSSPDSLSRLVSKHQSSPFCRSMQGLARGGGNVRLRHSSITLMLRRTYLWNATLTYGTLSVALMLLILYKVRGREGGVMKGRERGREKGKWGRR